MKRIVTFGEIMLRLSTPGYQRFVQARRFDATYGGSEANVAITLAGFGQQSIFVTRLPENGIGQAAENELRRYGVQTTDILRGGERIGTYYLEPGASQRPSNVVYDRKNSAVCQLKPGMINWDAIFEDTDWFHWSGITPALSDSINDVTKEACEAAKRNGLTVSCDLNYRNSLWSTDEAQEVMIPLMEFVDVCIANRGAARDSLGVELHKPSESDREKNPELARELKERFDFDVVALTNRTSLSASRNLWSALLHDSGECTEPVFSAEYDISIVDRVGGGDAFAGGLIYGLLEKERAADALEFAVAASCLKLTVPGDFNLVTVNEVEDLIKSGGSGRVKR